MKQGHSKWVGFMTREAAEDDQNQDGVADDSPINDDMISQMLIDVVVNDDDRVWVFHDKPFDGILEWAEYDADLARLVFVTKNGKINDLGLQIQPLMQKPLAQAEYIEAYLIQDKVFRDYAKVSLVTRGSV